MQEAINYMRDIDAKSIKLEPGQGAECSKCGIRYARDHIFTQEQFDSPCRYTLKDGKPCLGKWTKTTSPKKPGTHWSWC